MMRPARSLLVQIVRHTAGLVALAGWFVLVIGIISRVDGPEPGWKGLMLYFLLFGGPAMGILMWLVERD